MSLPLSLQDGVRFTCTDCGACCTGAPGRVQVSDAEIKLIAGYVGENEASLRARMVRRDDKGWSLKEHKDGRCVFFKDGRCSIHAVKPAQCALYPFWFSNVRSEEAWRATVQECEGIGQGAWIPPDEIEKQVRKDLERLKEQDV